MNWLAFSLQILPAILQAVIAIEQALPRDTPGAAKKQVLMSAVTTRAAPDEVIAISNLADSIVSALNTTGVLKHSPSTPPVGILKAL